LRGPAADAGTLAAARRHDVELREVIGSGEHSKVYRGDSPAAAAALAGLLLKLMYMILVLVLLSKLRACVDAGLCCNRDWAVKVVCLDVSHHLVIPNFIHSEAYPYNGRHPNVVCLIRH